MFGLLNSSYGLQHEHEREREEQQTATNVKCEHQINSKNKHHRTSSSVSDSARESRFFASLSSINGMKSPSNFIEKFLKSELLNGYDSLKTNKSFQQSSTSQATQHREHHQHQHHQRHHHHRYSNPEGSVLTSFNCLHGSYRSNRDGEFGESIHASTVKAQESEMTIKCSKNLLAEAPQPQPPATLQNYQKLPDCIHDLPVSAIAVNDGSGSGCGSTGLSSGASSGEFNSDSTTTNTSSGANSNTPVSSLYKKLSFGSKSSKNFDVSQTHSHCQSPSQLPITGNTISQEVPSDNSSSSISTTTNSSALKMKLVDLQRSSSASSSGDCNITTSTIHTISSSRERKKSSAANAGSTANSIDCSRAGAVTSTASANVSANSNCAQSNERVQRRKLMQMISSYDQHNKLLQRELTREKRRRTEELACVVKSLLCFESKLKTDMKAINQRLLEKDGEICRLVRQNRALRKRLAHFQKFAIESGDRDEGVVEDDVASEVEADIDTNVDADGQPKESVKRKTLEKNANYSGTQMEKELLEDCLVLEALQCINCRKQFYDIEVKEGWTQTNAKDGNRKNNDHTTEHGSSSDDTASSSFYGARRSVRYTSKRTAGTFRDYMRSRSMNIDDPSLEQNSEENTSTISRDDSQTSYEKMNMYSRTIERMHGVKVANEGPAEMEGVESHRSASRLSNKSNASSKPSGGTKSPTLEEDDGIFSPTQDDDFDEDIEAGRGPSTANRQLKIVQRRTTEFSEASPKQVYETSTDDWYASASDQDEMSSRSVSAKLYGRGAVNPVLECVNQILLQQSMEESVPERSTNLDVSVDVETLQQHHQLSTKSVNYLEVTANLPRRSSLSGRRAARVSNANEELGSRNSTLIRKRVHFSTKNSMVHVPRNDDPDIDDDDDGQQDEVAASDVNGNVVVVNNNNNDDDNGDDGNGYHANEFDDEADDVHTELISDSHQQQIIYHHSLNYLPSDLSQPNRSGHRATSIGPGSLVETERLDILNYESIYSNEYEPIGSEQNSSNLYVDMETTTKIGSSCSSSALSVDLKVPKMPPALPPKPANLLKFKKSLQQLDEMPDEHLQQQDYDASTTTGTSEPDYCSISEVNGGMTSVQIVADVHQVPSSDADLESQTQCLDDAPVSEFDVEVSTVLSDDTCAASQKTEEIEEIFADIPKLPNVAAIIAPKSPKYQPHPQSQTPIRSQLNQMPAQGDYLIMKPKLGADKLILTPNKSALLSTTIKSSPKVDSKMLALSLQPSQQHHQQLQQQYKRKHVPNILAEINKRMSLPNSPTTPTKPITLTKSKSNSLLLKANVDDALPNLPLQAEFDWYNLDAEYGKTPLNQPDLLKVTCDNLNGSKKLEEIHEDQESTIADEYNLDEEFSLTIEKPDVLAPPQETAQPPTVNKNIVKLQGLVSSTSTICEAVNFPLLCETSPLAMVPTAPLQNEKKIKKNLANFEKFIEGSGLSTKPLPNRRKIYFAGPFV